MPEVIGCCTRKGACVRCLPSAANPCPTVSISNLHNHKQTKGKYKSVKNWVGFLFLFVSEFWKNDPMRIEVAPFATWFWNQPLWLAWGPLTTFPAAVLSAPLAASLAVLRVLPRAAGADVVLLLCRLCRDAHTHLVEPLVAAAVALDPVHLVQDRQRGAQRRTKHLRPSGAAALWPVKCTSLCPLLLDTQLLWS